MATLVIKSFPKHLHSKLRGIAAAHRRSVTQETVYLLEKAIALEEGRGTGPGGETSPWADRKLLPEFEAMARSGDLTCDTDSATGLSEERDAR